MFSNKNTMVEIEHVDITECAVFLICIIIYLFNFFPTQIYLCWK